MTKRQTTKHQQHARLTAKKIKILKIEQVEGEPEKQRVELEVEGAPVPLPGPLVVPVELEAAELTESDVITLPEEKKGIINWLKSFWN